MGEADYSLDSRTGPVIKAAEMTGWVSEKTEARVLRFAVKPASCYARLLGITAGYFGLTLAMPPASAILREYLLIAGWKVLPPSC